MIRRFFTIIFIFIMIFFQTVSAEEIFKIKGVTLDTSSSVAILNTLGSYQSSVTDNIKLIKLPEEHKIYFDINSSILIGKKQDLFFTTGVIKEIKISQFTTNPNIVRTVMYFNDDYNLDNLKIGNINNHLIIMTNELSSTHAQFFQNSYRDKIKTAENYYDAFNIQVQSPNPQPAVITTTNNSKYSQKELTQIQQAFNQSTAEPIKQLVNSDISKNITLRSRYFINSVSQRNNGFLIGGYGAPTLQKPFVLANPTRMVFDIVNSNIVNSINNKEILLNPNNSQGDKIKIARFDNATTRIIVTSEKAKQYIPIFSPDNQSILIVNPENLSSNAIVSNKANIIKYKYQKNLSTDDFTLSFDKPVVWGIKRNTDKLYVYFFNASQYNDSILKSTINNTPYHEVELALLKNIGIRLTLPLNSNNDINTYFSADGKNFRIRASGLKPVITTPKVKPPVIVSGGKIKGKVIVIDAGHGGTDYGAIRNGINEKDINLDVAKRVEDILRRKGYKVGMTRTNDIFVSLENRCKISESMNPSIFVSIHVNSCVGTEPKGLETHYYHDNSVELANIIHSKLTKAIHSPNRGLFKSKFYVINHTSVPAVLLEIGFISNDNERAELTTSKRKQATAQAIAEGIIEYINSHK